MYKRLALFLLMAASPFYGQSAHRIYQVIQKAPNTSTAQIVPYARVVVCTDDDACSGVPVYQDPGLSVPYQQPLTADANGVYNYYVAPGCYKEQILTPGSPVRFIPGVCVSAPNGAGTGSVTSVSVASTNGFTGTVSNPSTTPNIAVSVDNTHYLPTVADQNSWNGKQAALGFTPENSTNKDKPSGYPGLDSNTLLKAAEFPAFTGDVSSSVGSTTLTLPSVNFSAGTCGDATHICQITTNAKGLTVSQTAVALNGVTTLSVGNLTPLFTANVSNPTTAPSVSFTLSAVNQNSVYAGPPSGGPGTPSFQTAPTFSAANLTNFPTLNQNTTGTAANLSGTPALPNGTTATTQPTGDNSTKLATTAFVLANTASAGVASINGTPGTYTFSGPGVSCSGTTCTFSGTGSGIGSITWALPSILAASPTTLSASGTQTFSLATQTANTVFAGPTSGSAAAPTFRALAAADLPLATTGAFGAVKPDGTTITISGGVITAVGGGGGGGTPGGTSGQVQYNNAGSFGGLTGIDTSAGAVTGVHVTGGSGLVASSGIIDGYYPVFVTTATAVTVAPSVTGGQCDDGTTARRCSGANYYNNVTGGTSAATFTLPPVVAGSWYCFENYSSVTSQMTLQTSGAGQYITQQGVDSASGGYASMGGALGDAVCLQGADSSHWFAKVASGTLTLH